MYEDRIQETIMNEMLEGFGANVRTDKNSVAYNACARIASALEDFYSDMEELDDNMCPDRSDLVHLIRSFEPRGVAYKYATAPKVKAVFQQEIEIGERFTCNDYSYIVTDLLSDFTYLLKCDTEGTEANTNLGELEPVDFIDDWKGGTITEIVSMGADDEDTEAYRKRCYNSYDSTAFGGNKADYRNFINKIDGVGGCKPMRREDGSEYINIWVQAADHMKPTETLISKIQELVDPEQSHGEGDGKAPICHNVIIKPVEESNVYVSMSIVFDTGYSQDTCRSQIESTIEKYFSELRASWESNEKNDTVIRLIQIESRVVAIDGILDVSNTTINGSGENLSIDYTHIPILGGVTIV